MVGGFERLTVMVCLALTLGLTVGWSALICSPTGWMKKMSIFYVIDAGLLRVTIGPGVAQEIVGAVLDQIAPESAEKLRNFFRGTFDQQEFKEYMCAIVLPPPLYDPCGIFQNLHMASWTLFGCVTFGCICSICAGLMLYYWCFVKPRKVMRQWIRALYAIASLLYLCGVFTYIMLTRDANNMPPRTEGSTFGPCVMISVVLTVFSALPLMIATVTVRETVEEAKNEMNSEKKEYEREVLRSQMAYGATGAAGYQQPDSVYQQQAGYQQQQQQQQQQLQQQQYQQQPMEVAPPNFSGGYQQGGYQQGGYAQGQQNYGQAQQGPAVQLGSAQGHTGQAVAGSGGYGAAPPPGTPAW